MHDHYDVNQEGIYSFIACVSTNVLCVSFECGQLVCFGSGAFDYNYVVDFIHFFVYLRPCWLGSCRVRPPRFLAECHERRRDGIWGSFGSLRLLCCSEFCIFPAVLFFCHFAQHFSRYCIQTAYVFLKVPYNLLTKLIMRLVPTASSVNS